MIQLSTLDLFMAAGLVLVLALISIWQQLDFQRQLVVAAVRTTVQLLLIGVVLKFVFDNASPVYISLIFLVMVLVAARELLARQKYRFSFWRSFAMGAFSMSLSTLTVGLFALLVIVQNQPWYEPQYAIPLLGMLLGNTLSSGSLAVDRMLTGVHQQRAVIEQKMLLGASAKEAVADISREAMRVGMMPIINGMAAAGVVSLPGMMTGQILAGAPPVEAVKYQILIMFLIATCTGFAVLTAIFLLKRFLFDERARLRLDRLRSKS